MINEQIEIKLILLGEAGVGKTSIINRFSYNTFYDLVESSLSTNYVSKDIKVYDKNIKLNLWDTIGQEKYRSLSTYFLKETEIVILVYSIISKRSFEQLDYWYNLYVDNLGKDVILGVIGNKSDLIMNQEVSDKEGFDYAKEHNAIFSLISVKQNGVGIDNFIEKIVQKYLDSKVGEDFEIIEVREKGITLSRKQIKEYGYDDKGCCGGKTKTRKKKYDEIIKNNEGYIYSVFLGANNVGKTSLINRIKDKQFNQNEEHTLVLNEVET